SLGEALAAALKLIIAEMRKIGEKVIRILVIGDGISVMSAMNPINLAKIAGELGIIIDAIRFGPAQVPGNVLKRITEITGGSYHFVNSEEELQESIIEVSKKKELIEKTLFNNLDNGSIRSNLLSEIAGNLLKLEELTPKQKYKIFQINPDKKLVCSICYSNNCINCETNFYGCGRFCPNCLTPFHLHCGMTWADQQNKDRNHKNKDKNKSKSKNNGNHYNNFYDEKFKIFRCVHCFYLLKIPVHNIATTVKNNMGNVRTAEKIYFKNASNEINTSICAHPECGVLFNESEDKIITRCNYCKSYFHEDCFNEYYKKEKICPYCNESVKLR
ncbi:MAG: VWA domain-containing protein, partial [archaeon]|nr:VWA domain-containing protein [archaeon]